MTDIAPAFRVLRPRRLVALATLVCLLLPIAAQGAQARPLDERQLLLVREAMQVMRQVGDDLWNDWNKAPKATLIIDGDREFLLNLPHGSPAPAGFEPVSQQFMGSLIYSRTRELPDPLRMAVDLDGLPTAVVGAWTPEVESPTEWVVTLVEQWFHVLQLDRGEPDKLAALGIGDAMIDSWQVEYAFPYDDPDVGNAMLLLGQALYDFWSRSSSLPREGQRVFLAETAWAAMRNLRTVLELKYGAESWSYVRMMSWRDGVARYSGLLVARAIARAEVLDDYEQVDGFEDLPQSQSYVQAWEDHMRARFWMIRTSGRPEERGRTSFHAIGHGIAEMLDVVYPEWKRSYFDREVWLDDLVAAALEQS